MRMDNSELMHELWDSLEKNEAGTHICYSSADIKMLWLLGFVDSERCDMQSWQQVFDIFRQADGNYYLSKSEFLALDTYRFKGEIFEPFDAFKINEGRYTHEGLQELITASIAPCCGKRGIESSREAAAPGRYPSENRP